MGGMRFSRENLDLANLEMIPNTFEGLHSYQLVEMASGTKNRRSGSLAIPSLLETVLN